MARTKQDYTALGSFQNNKVLASRDYYQPLGSKPLVPKSKGKERQIGAPDLEHHMVDVRIVRQRVCSDAHVDRQERRRLAVPRLELLLGVRHVLRF